MIRRSIPDLGAVERKKKSRHRGGDAGEVDGNTLLLVNPANTINASLDKKLNFRPANLSIE